MERDKQWEANARKRHGDAAWARQEPAPQQAASTPQRNFAQGLITTGEIIKNIGSLLIMLTLLVVFGLIFYVVAQTVL